MKRALLALGALALLGGAAAGAGLAWWRGALGDGSCVTTGFSKATGVARIR